MARTGKIILRAGRQGRAMTLTHYMREITRDWGTQREKGKHGTNTPVHWTSMEVAVPRRFPDKALK